MAYELRDGQGSLFTNESKTEGDNKPDVSGTCMIGGVKYSIAGWHKTAASGKIFTSLKISLPQERTVPEVKPVASEEEIPY